MSITISSQRYRDDQIVDAKRAARDYAVLVSPEFALDGQTYRVVLDGHHSLSAAMEDGAEPDYREATLMDTDAILLLSDDVQRFLEATHMGDDYYDISDGSLIW